MDSRVGYSRPKVRMEAEVDGKTVVFEGTARNAEIAHEANFEDVNSFYGSSVFKTSDTTTVTAEFDDYTVVVKEPIVATVVHTASILAEDRTVEAYERARRLAGAPKRAKMRVGDFQNYGGGELVLENLDEPNPIQVEFRWKEEVRSDRAAE